MWLFWYSIRQKLANLGTVLTNSVQFSYDPAVLRRQWWEESGSLGFAPEVTSDWSDLTCPYLHKYHVFYYSLPHSVSLPAWVQYQTIFHFFYVCVQKDKRTSGVWGMRSSCELCMWETYERASLDLPDLLPYVPPAARLDLLIL